MSTNQLTREQKLMAELVVQLGNIAEAIRAAAVGEDSSTLMTKIQELQTELTSAAQERSELSAALASANAKVADLQTSLSTVHEGDITPDSINEVMSTLGIDYDTV
jgi:septal ring factor EnvC (AmiA/AmiB activator)